MKTDESVTTIDTVEELTVHALDRTEEGLKQLSEDSIKCANAFSSASDTRLTELSALAQNLRDFDVFHSDICDLFQIDTATMRDEQGNLKEVEDDFHQILNSLLARISSADVAGIEQLLGHGLPQNLHRFQQLVPVLRDYVSNEYLGK